MAQLRNESPNSPILAQRSRSSSRRLDGWDAVSSAAASQRFQCCRAESLSGINPSMNEMQPKTAAHDASKKRTRRDGPAAKTSRRGAREGGSLGAGATDRRDH